MNCKETFESVSAYLDDELTPDEGDEFETHVERCGACKAFLNTLQRTLDFCRDTTVESLDGGARAELKESLKRRFIEALKALPGSA